MTISLTTFACAIKKEGNKGFVLVFTMFIVSMMLVITTSISTMLIKQLYFSRISRLSETAYYAADNAVACTILIDDTYVNNNGGIFPFNQADLPIDKQMTDALSEYNTNHPPSSISKEQITCAQSTFFAPSNHLTITNFQRTLPLGGTENGLTSIFDLKMKIDDTNYRCAKVTVNKTATYRQIIAQGYALCDHPEGTVERAVVNTSATE